MGFGLCVVELLIQVRAHMQLKHTTPDIKTAFPKISHVCPFNRVLALTVL